MVYDVVTAPLVWSPSAIASARLCPQQWLLTYGSGRQAQDRRAIPRDNALGLVMHSALQTAYTFARQELPHWHQPGTMDRFLQPAVDTLADRWRNLLLPEDDSMQAQLIAELAVVLESLPVPRAATILGIEETVHFTGRSGTPFKATLDLALRTGHAEIHIRDWKRRSFKNLPKPQELLDDVQLCQQRVAAHERWPWAHTVTVGLFSTTSALEAGPVTFPLERALYRLDGHEVTAHERENAERHPAVVGPACGGCPVRPLCPAFTT